MATMRFGSMCGSEWIRTERDHGISASLGELSDMQMDWLSFKIPDGVLKKAQLESAMVYRRSVINGTLNVEAESSVVRSLQKQNGMISSVYVPAAEVDEVAYGYCNGTLLPKLIGEEGARERFCLCLSEKGPNLISSILLSSGAVLMSMQFSSPIGATLFLTFHSDDWHAKPLKTTKVLDAFEHRDCKYCVARGDICECTSGVYVRACFNIREMVLRLQGVGLASPWERVRRAMTSGLSGNSTMEIGSVGSGQSPSRQAQVRFRWKATDFSDKSNADLLRVFLMKMLPPSINQDYQLTENSSSQSPDNLILDSRSVEDEKQNAGENKTKVKALSCEKCSATFRRSFNLRRHMENVHERKRKYVCVICSRAFGQLTHLNSHLKLIHKGEQESVCTLCRQTFENKFKLRRHQAAVHHRQRYFSCDLCDRKHYQRSDLRRHQQRVHGME